MVSVGKDRVQTHRTVKICLGTSEVTQIVFCNTSEKECPIVSCIKLGQDIEVFNGLGILSLRQGDTPTHHEHILVILRVKLMQGGT